MLAKKDNAYLECDPATPSSAMSVNGSGYNAASTVTSNEPGNLFSGTTNLQSTGTYEIKGINNSVFEFNIYPNPNNGTFTIEGEKISSIIVHNLLGDIVARTGAGTKTGLPKFDLSNQPKGVYIVKVTSGDHIKIKRVVYQ